MYHNFVPVPKATHSSSQLMSLKVEMANTTTSVSTVLIHNLLYTLLVVSTAWRNRWVSASLWEQGTKSLRSVSIGEHNTLLSSVTYKLW